MLKNVFSDDARGHGLEAMDPYSLGVTLQQEGDVLTDNPYEEGSTGWAMWREGYLQAEGTTLEQYWAWYVDHHHARGNRMLPPYYSAVDDEIYMRLWYERDPRALGNNLQK